MHWSADVQNVQQEVKEQRSEISTHTYNLKHSYAIFQVKTSCASAWSACYLKQYKYTVALGQDAVSQVF